MLQQRVLDTLRFFSLLGMPVTLFELRKYLLTDLSILREYTDNKHKFHTALPVLVPTSIHELALVLEGLISQSQVYERYGYYALSNQISSIDQRWRGHRYGVVRERLIRKYARILQLVPFVRGVALAGSQALGTEKQGSDIDLFVITAPKYMWLARTGLTAMLHVSGVRRYGARIANRFCLNHYVAGVQELQEKNIYTAFEYAKLRPVAYWAEVSAFQAENAEWIRSCFPNLTIRPIPVRERAITQLLLELLFKNFVGRWIEHKLGAMQRRRIHTEEFVVVRDDELSFHPNSKQAWLLEQFLDTKMQKKDSI